MPAKDLDREIEMKCSNFPYQDIACSWMYVSRHKSGFPAKVCRYCGDVKHMVPKEPLYKTTGWRPRGDSE